MGFDPTGSVDLGSAYGSIHVDLSNVEREFNQRIGLLEGGLGAAFGRIGAGFQRVGSQMTLAFAPITAFVGQGILAFANFDDVLTEIEARTGATADQMARVRDVALEMGQTTAFSAVDASNAMLQLLASGYDLNQTFMALRPVLDLAAAGNLDLGYAADAVTDILSQYNLEADQATVVTNALAKASGASSATVEDLVAAFANAGPVANLFGLSVDETAAALAVFAENGIKGSEAGTQLKSMLNNMVRDTDDVTGMWEELGVSMFDAEGNMRSLDDVIDDLNVAMDGMTDEERIRVIQTLAGSYGQLGLTALLSSGGIDTMLGSMEGAADAATVARARMASFKGIVNQLKSSIQTLSIVVLGPLVEQYLEPLAESVTGLVNKLIEWVIENPKLAGSLGLILAALAVLGPVLYGIGTYLKFAAAGFKMLGYAMSFLFTPMGLLILLIGLLALAFATNFLGIRDALQPVIDQVVAGIEEIIDWFEQLLDVFQAEGLEGALDFIGQTIADGFENILATVSGIDWGAVARSAWEAIKQGFAAVVTAGLNFTQWTIDHIWQPLIDAVGTINWAQVKDDVWAAIKAGFELAVSAALNFSQWTIDNIWQPLIDAVATTDWGQVKDDVWNAIKKGFALGVSAAWEAGAWVNTNIVQPVLSYLSTVNLGTVGDFLGRIYDGIATAVVNVTDWVNTNIVQPIKDKLGGAAVGDAGGFLRKLYDGAASAVVDVVAWVKTNVVQPVIDAVGKVDLGTVSDFLRDIFDAISTCVVDAVAWVKSHIVDPILNAVKDRDWSGAVCIVGDLFDAAAKAIVDVLGWVKTAIVDPILREIALIKWGDVGAFLQKVFDAIATGVVAVSEWVQANIVTPVVDELSTISLADIAAFLQRIFDAIASAIVDVATWVKTYIIDPIVNELSNVDLGTVGDFLVKVFDGIATSTINVADWVLTNIIEPIKTALTDKIPELGQKIVDTVRGALDYAAGVVSDIGGLFGLGGDDEDEREDSGPSTQAQIEELQRLKSWFDNNAPLIQGQLDGVKAKVLELVTELKSIGGEDVITALTNFQTTIEAAMAAADTAVNDTHGFIHMFIEKVNTIWSGVQDAVAAFQANIPGVFDPVNTAVQGATDTVQRLIDKFNELSGMSISVAVAVSGGEGVGVEAHAAGGRYGTGAPRLTGELGPELDVPNRSGMVVSNDQLGTALNVLTGGVGRMAEMLNNAASLASSIGSNRQAAGAMGPVGGGGGNQTITVGPINMQLVPPAGVDASEYGKQVADSFGERLKTRIRQTTGFAG